MAQARGLPEKLYSFFSVAAGAVFLLILGVITAGQRSFSFAYDRIYLLPIWGVALVVVALLILAAWIRRFFHMQTSHKNRWMRFLFCYFAVLLAAEWLVTRSLWFYPGWDVNSVCLTAGQIARGEVFDGSYFASCPNNSVITVILAIPLWVAEKLGLAVPYGVLPYLSTLLVNLSCLVCMLCVTILTESRIARWAALFFCTTWIAFSQTITVPYTDTFSILFPVLSLFVFLSDMRIFPKWLMIALLCGVGMAIKPTVIIFEIALIMVSAFRLFPLATMTYKRLCHIAVILIALVIGTIPGRMLYYGANLFLTGEAQPQGQLCDTHYLMLGMNDETYGGHSPEDNAFSLSYPTLAERRAATLEEAWIRFSDRSVSENVRFFAIKLYKAYSDGTLASNTSYLKLDTPKRTDSFSIWIRRFYNTNKEESFFVATVEQAIWLTILMLCALGFLGQRRRNEITALLGITLVGTTIYLMLFEVWPRYLYLYSPLFIIAASLGLEQLQLPTRLKKFLVGGKRCV